MRKIITDILFGFGTRVAIRLRGLLFIPLISVNLGVSAFGAYTQTLAIVTLLELVMCLGLHESLIRYGRQTDSLSDLYFSLFVVVAVASTLVAAVFYTFAVPLSRLTLGSPVYAEVYRFGAALIVTRTVIRLSRNYFRVDSRMKLFAAIQAVKVYAVVAAALATILLYDGGLTDIFRWIVIVEVGTIGVLNAQIIREVGFTVPTFTGLRKHLVYSIPITLSILAGNASSRVDRVVIGYFLGASAVGIYSMAYQISVAILMYVNPIRETFLPEFSSLFDEAELEKCGAYVSSGLRYFLLIALPSAGGIYLIGPDVISLLTAGRGTPSAMLMLLLALGMAANGTDKMYGVVLKAAEQTDIRAIIRGTGAVANLLLNIGMVPVFGIAGAAAVTLLTYLLTSGLTIWRVKTLLPTALPVGSVIRCLGATAVMVLAARFVNPEYLLATVALSVVVYVAALFVVQELTIEEIRLSP